MVVDLGKHKASTPYMIHQDKYQYLSHIVAGMAIYNNLDDVKGVRTNRYATR